MCSVSISMWLKQHCLCCIQGLQYAFLEAAITGDLDKVKDLIGQGCPVNTRDQVKFVLAQIYHRTYIAFCPTPSTHTIMHSVSHLYSHGDLVAWLLHCVQSAHVGLLPVIHCMYGQSALPVLCLLVILSIFIAWVECSALCCLGWPH